MPSGVRDMGFNTATNLFLIIGMAQLCNVSQPPTADEGDYWYNTRSSILYVWFLGSWFDDVVTANRHYETQWKRSQYLFNRLKKKSVEKITKRRKKVCIGNVSFPVKEFSYNWYYD